jgi:LysR family glycine cleavage system transcriptional activator
VAKRERQTSKPASKLAEGRERISSLATRRFVPPMGCLVAFESAARLGSFTSAAQELNLTQSAVSRQILQLEAQLGVQLFNRVKQRVVLSSIGRAYADEIRNTLNRFAAATAQAMAYRGMGGSLDLAVLPTLGARWLIPMLPKFFAEHRDVVVNFSTRTKLVDLRREGLDAAIIRGKPQQPGLDCHWLMPEELVAVASPQLVTSMRKNDPERLSGVPLLVQEARRGVWTDWFNAQGLPAPIHQNEVVFEQFILVIRAAAAGLGAAVVPKFLVEDELRLNELQLVPGRSLHNRDGYYLVYPSEYAERPPLQRFRTWLLQAAAQEARLSMSKVKA